jgi:hypothetical protein
MDRIIRLVMFSCDVLVYVFFFSCGNNEVDYCVLCRVCLTVIRNQYSIMSTDEEQHRLLEDSIKVVREQAFYMKVRVFNELWMSLCS